MKLISTCMWLNHCIIFSVLDTQLTVPPSYISFILAVYLFSSYSLFLLSSQYADIYCM